MIIRSFVQRPHPNPPLHQGEGKRCLARSCFTAAGLDFGHHFTTLVSVVYGTELETSAFFADQRNDDELEKVFDQVRWHQRRG